MFFICKYCDTRYMTHDDWMDHLVCKGHQGAVSKSISSWEPSLNERSLVVTINGKKPERNDICWYFNKFSLVTDVFFDSDLEFCVIQLDKKDYAVQALSAKHTMEGTTLKLRLKSEFSDAEWLLLNTKLRRKDSKKLATSRIKLFEEMHERLCKTFTGRPIDEQMEHFEKENRMNSTEFSLRLKLIKDLTSMCSRKYPKCIICPYGSFITSLGGQLSVLHLHFDASGQYSREGEKSKSLQETHVSQKELLGSLIGIILKIISKEEFCQNLEVNRCDAFGSDCIKFNHAATGISCRITTKSLITVQSSKLIDVILKLDSRLPPLFLLIRHWGKYRKLTSSLHVSSYTLDLLIIVFLTKNKIIPSVAALKSMNDKKKLIDGWETAFCEDIDKIKTVMSFFGLSSDCDKNPTRRTKAILELARDFFSMYGHLDLRTLVVCPLLGEFLPKCDFEPGKESSLPKTLDSYICRGIVLNTKSALCVQDPFDLGSNVSSQAPQDFIIKFQLCCTHAIANINSVLNSSLRNIMHIFNTSNSIKEDPSDQPTELQHLIIFKTGKLEESVEEVKKANVKMPEPEQTSTISSKSIICEYRKKANVALVKKNVFPAPHVKVNLSLKKTALPQSPLVFDEKDKKLPEDQVKASDNRKISAIKKTSVLEFDNTRLEYGNSKE